jgi:hypothetical protein
MTSSFSAASHSAEKSLNADDRLLDCSIAAIRRETDCDVGETLQKQIPDLARMLGTLRPTSLNDRGQLDDLAGAPPAHRPRGLKGVLVALGLDFLPVSDAGSGELICALSIDTPESVTRRSARILEVLHPEAENLAKAVGILTRLILQSIVDCLVKDRLTTAASFSVPPLQSVGTPEVRRVDAAKPLVARLRSSKLGDAFATWIAAYWKELLKNPRLQARPPLDGGVFSTVERAVSQHRIPVLPAPTAMAAEEPTFPSDVNMAAQAGTLVAAAAQGTPFCPI